MENKQEELKKVLGSLNSLLADTKLDDVSSESSGFESLPDGYYLTEVEKAELTVSKSSGSPMAAFQVKVVEDGVSANIDSKGLVDVTEIPRTKNRKIFLYYVLKNESSVKRFVADMLKFEGATAGESLLGKEYFTNAELLEDALDVLIGSRIYVNVATSENKDGSESTWNNLISWKRASALELPM